MEALKDSKVEWLGKIPKDWKVERIGTLYSLRNSKVSDEDYPPLSVTMQGILPQLETVAKTDDHSNRKLVKKGDFAINSRSDRRGSCGISDYDGSVSLINIVLKPNAKMNPVYYNWLFHTSLFADEFYKWGHGIVDDLWTTNWQDMKNIFVTIPPLDEQKLIADFLDEKCAEIDRLSEDIQKQIDILNDYKKSVITRAVTKGLDPNAEMKDSGVVAIGDIPSTWKLCRIKNLFIDNKSGIKVGPFGSALGQAVVSKYDGEYKVYGQANLIRRDFTYGDNYVKKKDYERLIAYKVLPGDIAVSMMGTIGKCMVVPADIEDGIMDSHLIKIRLKKGYNPNYFEYLYESDVVYIQLLLQNKGSIMAGLNSSIVKNIYFLEPPVEEQNEIVNYLDDICSKINSSIRAKNEQMVKMDSYKKSIIYEYVTGKKRVKGVL